ncbi:MAG: LysR family transcriptional regulator [Rhodocyclaceae bacterium]|nr:LysR family transcriptional regulator [Rhodocyclaceae bacterium]
MELRHLRYFVAVAEELNFRRAAERLHIGQPPLSIQIRALEEEVGARLLERSKRRVSLTEAGSRFLRRAREILAAAGEAVDEARQAARGELGSLRVGFTSSLPYTSILPDLLVAYRRRYPAVELQLKEMFTTDQLVAIAAGRLDVGLVRYVGGALPSGVSVRELGADPLCLVVNAAHPLANRESVRFAELADEGFITFPEGVGTGLPDILRRLCRDAGFEPRVVQTAREATTQVGLVGAGIGLALLPAPLSCIRLPRVRYVPIADADASFVLSVASPPDATSPLLAGFLAVLGEVAATADQAGAKR